MKFHIQKEVLLNGLQSVMGAVEKKQTFPILSFLLVDCQAEKLVITSTDSEIQLQTHISINRVEELGQATIPARKLFEICRALPDETDLLIQTNSTSTKIKMTCPGTNIALASLPPETFPLFEEGMAHLEFSIRSSELRYLFEKTAFAISLNDVRFYLNGLMMIVQGNSLLAASSNGHRLACTNLPMTAVTALPPTKFILPRKTVYELLHLLPNTDKTIDVQISNKGLKVNALDFSLNSKLIDTPFPDITKVIPERGTKQIVMDRDHFKTLLQRASIFTDEKFNSVKMEILPDKVRISASNQEQEILEEELPVEYEGPSLEVNLNIKYLQDLMAIQPPGDTQWFFQDEKSGIIIESVSDPNSIYLVMPMRV